MPGAFHLSEHARSRQAWELGDGEPVRVVVEPRGTSGPAMAAARLGEPVPGREGSRAFAVRGQDVFLRWLLSFAGELVPVEPADLVAAYRALARRTGELYAPERHGLGGAQEAGAPRTDAARDATNGGTGPAERGEAKGAAVQLRRILLLVPELADGEEHSIAEVAGRIGTDARTDRKSVV